MKKYIQMIIEEFKLIIIVLYIVSYYRYDKQLSYKVEVFIF